MTMTPDMSQSICRFAYVVLVEFTPGIKAIRYLSCQIFILNMIFLHKNRVENTLNWVIQTDCPSAVIHFCIRPLKIPYHSDNKWNDVNGGNCLKLFCRFCISGTNSAGPTLWRPTPPQWSSRCPWMRSTSSRSGLLEKEEKAAAADRSLFPKYQVDRPLLVDLIWIPFWIYAIFYLRGKRFKLTIINKYNI